MARRYFSAALLVTAAALTGCTGEARFVQKDAGGGIVAIPNDSLFRSYYRDEAMKKIRAEHTGQFEIIREQEVEVGEQTVNNQVTDRRPIGPDGKPIGERTTNTNVSTTTKQKEYWIEYKIASRGAAAPTGNTPRGPATTALPVDKNVIPAGGAMPRTNVNAGGMTNNNPTNFNTPMGTGAGNSNSIKLDSVSTTDLNSVGIPASGAQKPAVNTPMTGQPINNVDPRMMQPPPMMNTGSNPLNFNSR